MKAEGISGRIPASLQAEPGRALGRLTDLGWGNRLRRVLADDAPDAPVSEEVFAAVVEVLTAWDWSQRPAGVVAMASATRPGMIADLARRVAAIGRLPYLGEIAYTGGGPGPRRHNSAQRVRTLWNALAVPGLAGLDRARSCSWTTGSTPAGRSPSPPSSCARRAPRRSCLSFSPSPPDTGRFANR